MEDNVLAFGILTSILVVSYLYMVDWDYWGTVLRKTVKQDLQWVSVGAILVMILLGLSFM